MGGAKRRRVLQFSLRTVLVVMTFAALVLGAVFAMPIGVFSYILLVSHVPVVTVFVVCAVYGRGYFRTFAIGAGLPAGLVLFSPYLIQFVYYGFDDFIDESSGSTTARLVFVGYLVVGVLLCVVNGGLAMVVRWLVEKDRETISDCGEVVETTSGAPSEGENVPE